MAYKIYGKGNYLFIDDTLTGLRHEQLKKNVFVEKEAQTALIYHIKPLLAIGGIRLTLVSTDILKENGTPYTDAEWVTFYTENTGNFNGGGGASQTTTVVENYSALPDPTTVPDQFYFVKNSQGTKWLPGSLGGTYYSNGLYYSDGVTWFYTNLPYQADLPTVNLGINTSEFITPYTFDNSNKILNSFQKNIDNTDDITEGVKTFVPALPLNPNVFLNGNGLFSSTPLTALFPPDFLYQTIQVVQTLADFPAPTGNEIFLNNNTIYFIDNGDLDISDYTLVFNQRSQINGFGQNVSKISSTTAGTLGNPYVFFRSETNLFMNDLEIECKGNYQLIWEHIGNGTVPEGESFELNRFNILNEQTVGHGCQLGYIKNIRQGFIGTFSCFNFENGFICAGAWTGGFRIENTIFIFCRGVFFGSDALMPVTFARRVASNANLTVPSGSIGYDFPETAFNFDGQYQLQNGNVSGAGTYVTLWSGLHPAFYPKSNFKDNTGIQNSFPGGEFVTNADNNTTFTAINTWTPAIFTTINKDLTWVNEAAGVFTYNSDNPLDAFLIYTLSMVGQANNIIQVKLVKEDLAMVQTDLIIRNITIQGTLAQGRAESVPISTTGRFFKGDKLRVYYRNLSGTQTVTTLSNSNGIISAK